MSNTIEIHIVSAEKELFSGEANAVFASAEMGEVGIFPRHAPFLSKLKPGQIRIRVDGRPDEYFFVSGGIIEVPALDRDHSFRYRRARGRS